jgi:hypothetical protein
MRAGAMAECHSKDGGASMAIGVDGVDSTMDRTPEGGANVIDRHITMITATATKVRTASTLSTLPPPSRPRDGYLRRPVCLDSALDYHRHRRLPTMVEAGIRTGTGIEPATEVTTTVGTTDGTTAAMPHRHLRPTDMVGVMIGRLRTMEGATEETTGHTMTDAGTGGVAGGIDELKSINGICQGCIYYV